MNEDRVVYTVEDGIARVHMNCPQQLNPLDQPMVDALYEAFHAAEADHNVRVVIWSGEGKHFSGGGSLNIFQDLVDSDDPHVFEPLERQARMMGGVIDFVKKMKKVVICEVQGAAAGGGATMALAADFCFCTDNAKFVQAFVNIALCPDICGTYLILKQLRYKDAMDLIFTGRTVYAEEAKDLGLVYQVCEKEALHDEVIAFAKKIAKGPGVAYGNMKRQVYEIQYRGMIEYLEQTELPLQGTCFRSEDFKEGVHAFLEKRKPEYQGK